MRSKILFLGMPTCLFFHGTQDGSHFGSRFGVYNGFFLAMLAECVRMREQLCHIDHPDPITNMPFTSFYEIFGFCFTTSHPLDALLTSLPGPGRCPACQRDHRRTWPPRQPDWGRGSQGLPAAAQGVWRTIEIIVIQWIYFSGSTICSRDEFGILSRYESRSFNKPSATRKIDGSC